MVFCEEFFTSVLAATIEGTGVRYGQEKLASISFVTENKVNHTCVTKFI